MQLHEFQLLAETEGPATEGVPSLEPLRLDDAPSWLHLRAGLHQRAGGLTLEKTGGSTACLLFEPVRAGGRAQLLTSPLARGVRCNGLPLPRLAVLEIGARLDVPGAPTLHVSALRRPRLGPPRADQIGKSCPVCRLALVEHTTIWTCPLCAAVLHAEGEERPEEKRLECLQLVSACPSCEGSLSLEAGLLYTPEI